ncbi:b(0,+)-type amino acid transporter 1-like isoform X1 [Dermatophagoides pteronyssinus]|uniref:b(0,+)-type amino acid transporter 1-like isoform X1 n=2 Tax=Dermatophagoides pteronyssinus TaxID=6956 RepID=UPI003F66F7F3
MLFQNHPQSKVASNGDLGHAHAATSNKDKIKIADDMNKTVKNNNNNHFGPFLSNARNFSEGDVSIVGLKRRVGFISGTALIVGTMIGSGIFVSPKGVLERSGSVGMSLIVWIGSGLISLLGALCYAELGTLITKSGAEYSYILESFGGLLAFLFSWISVFVLKPAMLSIICLTLSEYIVQPFFLECQPNNFAIKLIAIFFIVTITYVNCYSVNLATSTQNIFTAAKLLAIIIIICGGIVHIFQGHTEYISKGFEGSKFAISDIATAFYSGLWAYDGWNNLNYVTEELINPYRNLPLAIICGIPIVTLCYVLVNISYMSVMSTEEILMSDAVAVTWGNQILGFAAIIIPISVALSSFGAGNGSCFTSGRLAFAAAREGHLIDVLSYIDMKRYTPSPALVFNAFLSILLILPSNIESLIDFFSFTAWLFYGATMLALIILRYKSPYKDKFRPYKVHLSLPIIVFLISIYLVIGPIIENPQIEYLYATLYIVSGLLVYVPFVKYKIKCHRLLNIITWTTQLIFKAVPCEYVPESSPEEEELQESNQQEE